MTLRGDFKFKQFSISHDKSSMPVGTDAVLLGAWANVAHCSSVLDIGTGCGIIAIMIAQRSHAEIDAIDCDADSVEEAACNSKRTIWADRINVFQSLLQELDKKDEYDLIVCNPPYFIRGIECRNTSRTRARQQQCFEMEDLFRFSGLALKTAGSLCLIYPAERRNELVEQAEKHGLFVKNITFVYPTPYKKPKRVLMEFVKGYSGEPKECSITVETGVRHEYTSEYQALTSAFYTAF
jgi:tRNA1Val (adenine37-N6)-methyltransferase